jgi:pyridinium-3,5-bisthiocarboxylic acid mononucleotide nickel chelatase
MVRIGYWECPTGISGDMCLGALVDLGVPWQYLVDSLRSLGIEQEYQLKTAKVMRNGQAATKVDVVCLEPESTDTSHHHHHHYPARHLPEIENLIKSATLPDRVKQWSLDIFKQLAIAEGEVHGIAPTQVHFHEVGGTDAIVDIVGTCIGLDWLDLDELYCSPMPTGGGTVKAAHGILPVPVPAVVKLWQAREVPIYSNSIKKELVTPTGAAIATTLAVGFGEPPAMKLEKIGLGAGSRDLEIPNILRFWLGEKTTATEQPPVLWQQESITVLETQIDDLNPQAVAYTLEQLLATGALDVFTQSIGMKKSRSGILLTVICHPELVNTCKTVIFQETTTLGIRERTQLRSMLNREFKSVTTPYGVVKVKIASWGEGKKQQIINVQPEYEDCAALARQHNVPWKEISQKAVSAWENYN